MGPLPRADGQRHASRPDKNVFRPDSGQRLLHGRSLLTQFWAALCDLLMPAYIKFQAKCRFLLFYLHRMIRETLFERFSLI